MSLTEHDDSAKTSDNSPLSENMKNQELPVLKNGDFVQNTKKESEVIQLINRIILEIIQDNKNEMTKNKNSNIPKTIFFMKNLPNIKFIDYLNRINKYLKPELSSFIIALIFVDRICSDKTNKILLIDNNVFKLFLTAIILAIKYNEDFYDDNQYFAKVGGVTLAEINVLEKVFLDLLDFRLFVPIEVFSKYNNYLINY